MQKSKITIFKNKINDISPSIKYSKIGSKKENKSNNENLVNDEIMLKY